MTEPADSNEPIPLSPFEPRQSNTGLYCQMHRLGYSEDQLLDVQQAYRLASRLSNGRYRKNERPFICHAIGAASAAAEFTDDHSLVMAALLHATYDSGQFPDGGIGGATPTHRRWLQQHIPAEVEAIVYRYDQFDFEIGAPERLVEEGYDESDSDLLYMALTHEIDDVADFGLWFAAKYGMSIQTRLEACAILAERINKPALAVNLRAHEQVYRNSDYWLEALSQKKLQGHLKIPNTVTYLRHRLRHLRRRPIKLT